jgi:glycosyltransferase involved in cell wall biosynthesis
MTPHICVCVCTYRRPQLLEQLLTDLERQHTDTRFTYSVVVADNDARESAAPIVRAWAARSSLAICYCVEPRQNIALARNKAIEHVHGDLVAFIDDDERPMERWLLTLLTAYEKYGGVDGVLGPVKPHFDDGAPGWVVEGKFYDRPSYPTGLVIDARKGRTGNVLLDRRLFEGLDLPFRPEFLTGEDQDFFRRMIEKGHVFIWCDEAVAFEAVPALRWRRRFMLKRALLRGAMSLRHPTFGARHVATSLIAIPTYIAYLPLALMLGQSDFMNCLVRLFDHAGRLLAVAGIHPVAERYVTE